ncbi:MAG: hypothetical protein VX834_06635 [Myxococcota bacterium]|nr:hypothetical protein [Myxococcota bacterium]
MPWIQLATVLVIALLTSACGDVYEEKRLYGTWVEPLHGAIIEFQEDGTLIWDGEVGTFEFVRSTNWAVCTGVGGCDDGQVAISLPGQSFRKSLYERQMSDEPNRFFMTARNSTGFPKKINIYGKSVDSFTLYREGTFSGDLMPDHFSQMNAGIPDEYYFTTYVNSPTTMAGELVAEIAYTLRRFDESEQRWVDIGSQYDMVWPPNGPVLYKNDPPSGEPHQISFDAGRSWTNVPSRGDGFGRSLLDGTMAVSVDASYDQELDALGAMSFWTMDLSSQSPTWTQVGELPAGSANGLTYQYQEIGVLVIETWQDGEPEYQLSMDYGATWTPFTDPCRGSSPQRHAGGIHCLNENDTLSWFDFETLAWTEYDVGFELSRGSLAQGPYDSDAAYLVNDQQLIAWRPDSVESITDLSDNITGSVGKVMVLNDQVLVKKVTLWRTER